MSKQITIRLKDEYQKKLQYIMDKWNQEDEDLNRLYKPYNSTDIIHIIIGMVYDMETDPEIQAQINESNKTDS